MISRITDNLAREIEGVGSRTVLNVVLELRTESLPNTADHRSRKEKIVIRQRAFEAVAGAVKNAITTIGGTILETAWINNTILARVPAKEIPQLAKLDGVETVDLPQHIHIESA